MNICRVISFTPLTALWDGFHDHPVLTVGKQKLRELELLSQGCTISAEPSWLLSLLGLKTPKARSTGPDSSSYGIWGSWRDIERDKWRQTNHHRPVEDQKCYIPWRFPLMNHKMGYSVWNHSCEIKSPIPYKHLDKIGAICIMKQQVGWPSSTQKLPEFP